MSMMSTDKIQRTQLLKIALLGFEGGVLASLQFFFDGKDGFQLVPPEKSDCLIINGDQGKAPETLRLYYTQKYTGKPGIVISVREFDWPEYRLLKKPYQSAQLLALLAEVNKDTGVGSASPEKGFSLSAAGDKRSEVFEAYQQRQGAGQSVMEAYNQDKNDYSRQQAALKDKLRKGRNAQELAKRLLKEQQERLSKAPVKPVAVIEKEKTQTVKKALGPQTLDDLVALAKNSENSVAELMEAPSAAPANPPQVAEKNKASSSNISAIKSDTAEPSPQDLASNDDNSSGGTVQSNESIEKVEIVPTPMTEEMIHLCCGNLPDINLTRADELKRVRFNMDGSLISWLQMAIRKSKLAEVPIEVAGVPRALVYLNKSESFYCDFNLDLLEQLAMTRFGFGELELRERLDFAAVLPTVSKGDDSKMLLDADQLIWDVTLWTTQGRLLTALNADKPYKLVKLPDFKRMLCTPHAEKIGEVWLNNRLSVIDLVRIMRVPQRYIFAYMAAAYASGYLQE